MQHPLVGKKGHIGRGERPKRALVSGVAFHQSIRTNSSKRFFKKGEQGREGNGDLPFELA